MDMLRAARHSIYIEAQYFVNFAVGDLLARHLARHDGPEIVIVTSQTLPGAFERFVMGSNRDRLIRRMRRADRFDRLRVYHPVVPAEGDVREVLIHAKLIIVDDVFAADRLVQPQQSLGRARYRVRPRDRGRQRGRAAQHQAAARAPARRAPRRRARRAWHRRSAAEGSLIRAIERAEPQCARAAPVRGGIDVRTRPAPLRHLAARPAAGRSSRSGSCARSAEGARAPLVLSPADPTVCLLSCAPARSHQQLDEREQDAAEAQRHQEISQAEQDQRADDLLPRQQEQHHALDHAEPAGHVAEQRCDIGDHVDGGDAEIGHVCRGRERLVKAGGHEGKVQRPDDRPDRARASGSAPRSDQRRNRSGRRTKAASAR